MNIAKIIDWFTNEYEKADEDEHVIRSCVKTFGIGCLEGLSNIIFCYGLIWIGDFIIELFKNKVNK